MTKDGNRPEGRPGTTLHRVVVTGTGMVTPLGMGVENSWRELVAGRHGIGPITLFDASDQRCPFAAEVKNFNPRDYFDHREARRMDRYSHFALLAAAEAIEQAKLEIAPEESFRVGVIVASGIGGVETFQTEVLNLGARGPRGVSPLFIPMMIGNMAAGLISMKYGARGDNMDITTACASGSHAIGEAWRKIRHGYLDACIAGGSEAPICRVAVAGFSNMTALTTATDVERASIPFDAERSGFVIGEGAGILVLESLEHAEARGATILAEIGGYGATGDAYHMTAPDPEGEGALGAMRHAIAEAGLAPEDIDYVNAHGTSTPLNDRVETLALKRLFGDRAYEVPVSSTKSMMGHLLGAAGAVEAAILVEVLRHGLIPPTVGYRTADPDCDLDYVTGGAREAHVCAALSNSLGFGGHNASLLLKRAEA
ncbi:MAG: beta-ketoacyl-ACP synthase II [Bacillota bacterium]|nr:beta-ketoacyl-ACP synthase II [Bacillota bacterium]